jgi:hypothetical protein
MTSVYIVFAWETFIKHPSKSMGMEYRSIDDTIRDIFYKDSIEPIVKALSQKAKKAYQFVKGTLHRENLPVLFAECCGYVAGYGCAIAATVTLHNINAPAYINAIVSVMTKDVFFWAGNIAGYKAGHYLFAREKEYPKHYFKTMVLANFYATAVKAPFQMLAMYGLDKIPDIPPAASFLAAQFVPGAVGVIIRGIKTYRGKIWVSRKDNNTAKR